jgi:hypothetical protein
VEKGGGLMTNESREGNKNEKSFENDVVKSLNYSKEKILEILVSLNADDEIRVEMWNHLKEIDQGLLKCIDAQLKEPFGLQTYNDVQDIKIELKEVKKILKDSKK